MNKQQMAQAEALLKQLKAQQAKTKAKPQSQPQPKATQKPKSKSSWIAVLSYINQHWLQLTIAMILGRYLETIALGLQSFMLWAGSIQ